MAERRSLVEGVKKADAIDTSLEKEFVFGGQARAGQPVQLPPAAPSREGKGGHPATAISRVPLTTRVRSDFAAALKRASLERQLNGELPNSLQDILDDALEPWLRSHGYLN
jgi:hypothetical protein